MNKLFPTMFSKPEKTQIIATVPFLIWVFVLVPMFMPFLADGLWEQGAISVWFEIGYHILNGVVMLFIAFSYLKDEWFMFTTDLRFYLKHIALTLGLIVGVELILLDIVWLCDLNVIAMLDNLPAVEMLVVHTPLSMIDFQPVLGTIVASVFVPISICTLFYCPVFATICYKKPWLAYLCLAIVTLIPAIINILWRGEVELALSGYVVQLPIHLFACWSYQKTDNVWTPLISLAGTNLLASIVGWVILQVFFL